MTIYQGTYPQTVEVEQTLFPSAMTAGALYEFLDSAEHHEHPEDAPGWGATEWVFPACSFDGAFLLTLNDPGFRAAKHSGLIRVELTEREDGDDRDSITLVATDRMGREKFRQVYVFER